MIDRKLLRNIIIATLGLLVFGTLSFMYTARLSFGEAFYETLIILLSHFDHYGFDDPTSRVVVVFLVVSSIIVVAYLLKVGADYIVSLGDGLRRQHMKRIAQKINHHYIICGLGRVGTQVAQELADEGVPFIGIDHNEERVKNAIAKGITAVVGDSTKEEILKHVGIERAIGIVASLGEDSSNLFVTLAARQLNPDIFIVSRVNREENRQRISRAGADRTAMPYQIGGYHMATMLVRPNVVDFLEILANNNNSDLQVLELEVGKSSQVVGQKLAWLYSHSGDGTVLALNTADGLSKVNPSGSETVYAGDKLIVMGTAVQLKHMSELM
ncbi:NAD-binding protein [Candidatus Saccharibacteria bacterium]|nr:NAD-binding protein [Candidatus Saccharibacteria bacterium]